MPRLARVARQGGGRVAEQAGSGLRTLDDSDDAVVATEGQIVGPLRDGAKVSIGPTADALVTLIGDAEREADTDDHHRVGHGRRDAAHGESSIVRGADAARGDIPRIARRDTTGVGDDDADLVIAGIDDE